MRTIAHISDLHFGREDPVIADALAAELQSLRPTLIVASGDFTQRGRERQYEKAAKFLRRLPSPVLAVPGNHDVPLFDVTRRFFFPLHRYRRLIERNLRPVYQDDRMIVIGINTTRPISFTWNGFWKDGRISAEQLLDIKLRMCDLPPQVFKVVVTHHPFLPPQGERPHGIVHGAERALAVMERCGVDLLLAGHLHMGYSGDVRTHYEAVKRSIISVQAGTTVSTRRRGEPNAWNFITLDGPRLTVEVRAWKESRFEAASRSIYVRENGQWRMEPVA